MYWPCYHLKKCQGQPFYLLNGGKWGQLHSSKSTGLSKLGRAQKKNSPMIGQEHLKTGLFLPTKNAVEGLLLSQSCALTGPGVSYGWRKSSCCHVPATSHPERLGWPPLALGGRLPFRGRGATIRQESTLWRPGLTWWWAQGCPHRWPCQPAPMGNTNCLQWRAESSGSFFLFLSPDSHPSKQYSWDASALKRILRDSPSS